MNRCDCMTIYSRETKNGRATGLDLWRGRERTNGKGAIVTRRRNRPGDEVRPGLRGPRVRTLRSISTGDGVRGGQACRGGGFALAKKNRSANERGETPAD